MGTDIVVRTSLTDPGHIGPTQAAAPVLRSITSFKISSVSTASHGSGLCIGRLRIAAAARSARNPTNMCKASWLIPASSLATSFTRTQSEAVIMLLNPSIDSAM